MVGPGMFNGVFTGLIIAVIFFCGIFFLGGWLLGRTQYKKGYLQGQVDYRNGKVKIQNDTTYRIKLAK